MTYASAKKLHNEDEVILKKAPVILKVVQVIIDEPHKDVYVVCDDGNEYHHREIV